MKLKQIDGSGMVVIAFVVFFGLLACVLNNPWLFLPGAAVVLWYVVEVTPALNEEVARNDESDL